MKEINLVELLKNCPKGLELDCPMFDGLEFDHIATTNKNYPIVCRIKNSYGGYDAHAFTPRGSYNDYEYSKCVIFPKGKTTWEGFQKPFVEGDVIYTDDFIAILSNIPESGTVRYHCYYHVATKAFKAKHDYGIGNIKYDEFRFATEEEKEKLFQAIKDNGYKWNPETKILEKLPTQKSKISWHTGVPENLGDYLVSLSDGRVSTDTYLESTKHWDRYRAGQIVAWCPVEEIDPYNHN